MWLPVAGCVQAKFDAKAGMKAAKRLHQVRTAVACNVCAPSRNVLGLRLRVRRRCAEFEQPDFVWLSKVTRVDL